MFLVKQATSYIGWYGWMLVVLHLISFLSSYIKINSEKRDLDVLHP